MCVFSPPENKMSVVILIRGSPRMGIVTHDFFIFFIFFGFSDVMGRVGIKYYGVWYSYE